MVNLNMEKCVLGYMWMSRHTLTSDFSTSTFPSLFWTLHRLSVEKRHPFKSFGHGRRPPAKDRGKGQEKRGFTWNTSPVIPSPSFRKTKCLWLFPGVPCTGARQALVLLPSDPIGASAVLSACGRAQQWQRALAVLTAGEAHADAAWTHRKETQPNSRRTFLQPKNVRMASGWG